LPKELELGHKERDLPEKDAVWIIHLSVGIRVSTSAHFDKLVL
jgi:hypothetical protein